MRKMWIVTVMASAAFVSALSQGPDKPLRIAVVDVGRVIQGSTTIKKIKAATDVKIKAWLDELEALKARYDKLKKERTDLHTPGTQSHDKLGQQLAVLQAEIKSKDAMYTKWSNESDTQAMIQIYERVDKELAAISTTQGIDVVFRVRGTPAGPVTGRNALRLVQFKSARDVLYATERVDLTKAVIQALDRGGK